MKFPILVIYDFIKGNLIIKQAPPKSILSLFVSSIVPLKEFIISFEIDKPRPE
tara:strand:- start:31 stop:189 length:159 start_codon:yes stop_codon:yes gene_type:complete